MSPRHEVYDSWNLSGGEAADEDVEWPRPARPRLETYQDLPYMELRGHGDVLVKFVEPQVPKTMRDAGGFLFALDALGVRAHGSSWEEAKLRAADMIARDLDRLTRTFVDELTEEEDAYRLRLLANVDLLGGEIGIDFPTDRWLLGTLQGEVFIPVQDDFDPIPIPTGLRRVAEVGELRMARVATYRDGAPKGEILEIAATAERHDVDEEAE